MKTSDMSPHEALFWLAACPFILLALCSPGMAGATVIALYLDEGDIERWMFWGGLANLGVFLSVWFVAYYGKSRKKPEGEASQG